MSDWDSVYAARGHQWGDRAGVLLDYVAALVSASPSSSAPMRVLDVGCGYGKDTPYLAAATGGPVIGIDPSPRAIELARQAQPNLPFEVADISGAPALGPFDIVHAANVYHLLRATERASFLVSARDALVPGGHVVLNALSVSDPEEYGSGEPVEGDSGSFVRNSRYGHFFARDELEDEAAAAGFTLERLEEVSYEEPHAGGRTHRHTGWVLVAARSA